MASWTNFFKRRPDKSDAELRQIVKHLLQNQTKMALYGESLGSTQQGIPQRSNRDMSQYAHEGYKLNSVGYTCIQRIAKMFGTISWQVVTNDANDPEVVQNHPLVSLLRRPNSQKQGVEFFEEYAVNYFATGNSYIDGTVFGNNITELWLPKPYRVEAIPGKFGTPERYKHQVNGQTNSWWLDVLSGAPDLARSDDHMLLHSRTANPTADEGADYYGLSPMEAAAYAIDQHNAASVHNKSLLDQGMTPSGAIKYSPPEESGLEGQMSDASYNRLKEMLRETQQGAQNAGGALILEGYTEYVQMGITPKDGDFNESKKGVAREICNVFGVPFILVVEGQSTYNNVKEARLELANETVIPFAQRFASDFNTFIEFIYPEVRIRPDLLSIAAVRENAIEQAAKVDAITHFTTNEKRIAGGLFTDPVEGGDDILVPAGLLPLTFEVDDNDSDVSDE